MKPVFLVLFLLIALSPSMSMAFPGDISGEASVELRNYSHQGAYGSQPMGEGSFILKPEFGHAWDNDRKVINFIPFVRVNSEDEDKSHFDIRELSYVASHNDFEVRLGISKVFWGVTESQHLVDVINQSDFVENPDGEDKLGQPMLNTTYVSQFGNVTFFILPYFRERTFSGENGRFRVGTPIANGEAIYLNYKGQDHLDYALRWSHYHEDLDWGLSYFKGTDRDPIFTFTDGELIPTYGLSEQFGLEVQYVYHDWLLKIEGIKKDSETNGDYHASVTGFEYSFSNIYGGKDIGLIYEWQWDERSKENPVGISNASFFGTRFAFNDEQGSELLAGGLVNNDNGHYVSTRVEASRRLGQNFKLEFELNLIDSPPEESLLNSVKEDDYSQISISYFW